MARGDGVKPACDAARVETGGDGGSLRRDGSALVTAPFVENQRYARQR
jgi:hypothetical protein